MCRVRSAGAIFFIVCEFIAAEPSDNKFDKNYQILIGCQRVNVNFSVNFGILFTELINFKIGKCVAFGAPAPFSS